MAQKNKITEQSPLIIMLTLPHENTLSELGTLLIQRGELAHVRQFAYTQVSDIVEAVQAAMDALVLIESNPPVIADLPPGKTTAKTAPSPEPEQPQEPTIDIPVKKGVVTVPISYLKITGGETDAAAYRQAVQIAGKLITGGLWDGKTPIRIDDVYRVQRQLKGLSDKEMSLFTLEDFAQRGTVEPPSEDDLSEETHTVSDEQGNDQPERLDDSGGNDQPGLL